MTTNEIQALLSVHEALVAFSVGDAESYVFALTRDAVAWKKIPLGARELEEKVAALRQGLDVEVLEKKDLDDLGKERALFDLAAAHELYETLFAPVEALIKDRPHLVVVPTGALTALPFALLVTEKPAVAAPPAKDKVTARDLALYRQAAWLARQHRHQRAASGGDPEGAAAVFAQGPGSKATCRVRRSDLRPRGTSSGLGRAGQ